MRNKYDWKPGDPDEWPSERIPIEIWGAIYGAMLSLVFVLFYTDWYNYVLDWLFN